MPRWTLASVVFALPLLPLNAAADSLTVHEWGTFTTLSSSSGEPLSGLFVDASRLPDFVHGLPFFNYDPTRGWPDVRNLRNVTVKMETPVLYFYSDRARDVNVEVGFKGGTISQWYPERVSGEANPSGPVDLSHPYDGRIAWKARILDTGTALPYTSPASQETGEWTAPRNTQANLLRGQSGEIEKFLFYRGLGNFSSSVETRFTPEGSLSITNRGADGISHVMVYELSHDSAMGSPPSIWWEGALSAGQTVTVPRAKPDWQAVTSATSRFQAAMAAAGLYRDESQALLNTWSQSYFSVERGLKVFWLVPRPEIDRILPLKILPVPDHLERVIVGRSEILTPEFEAELIRAYRDGSLAKFKSDKYYLAYLDLLERKGYAIQSSANRAAIAVGSQGGSGPVHGRVAGRYIWGIWNGGQESGRARDLQGRMWPVLPPLP